MTEQRWYSKTICSSLILMVFLYLTCGDARMSSKCGRETLSVTCNNAHTLQELIQCIRNYLPPRDSDIYITPDPLLFNIWKQMIGQMLAGGCSAIQVPPEFSGFYEIRSFTDNQNGQTYCVLMETGDINGDDFVDYGWGTYIVNPDYTNELVIQVPHPSDDLDTEQEGIQIFKGTGARVFMMAGSSPDASTSISNCQTEYRISDVCHNVDTIFEVTFMQIMEYYETAGFNYLAIQFHGMSDAVCPGVDVFMTHGVTTPPIPTDAVYRLKTGMEALHPDWVIRVPGEEPPCDYYGSTNVQARTCNGVPFELACSQFASSYSGRFIHIEQKPLMREADDWIEAVNEVMLLPPLPATGWVSGAFLMGVVTALLRRRNR